MAQDEIERLKQEYTGRQVTVDEHRPELARFAGRLGEVKTINSNGRALVQFEGVDIAWYDIELDYLKLVEEPQPAAQKGEGSDAVGDAPPS